MPEVHATMPDAAEKPAVVKQVDDVETLRALSDPIRLAIMRALLADVATPTTVKELAQKLDQPQTRLYRHIKTLESAGLIKVVETRLVSGIMESRYQVAQLALRLSRDLLSEPSNASEVADAFAATLDDFRGRLVHDILAGRLGGKAPGGTDASSAPTPMVVALDKRISRARAAEFRSRLQELMDEFNRPDEEEAVVPVEFLLMFWSPVDPA